MKLKVTPDPSHSHRDPDSDLLRQLDNSSVSNIPAAIKLRDQRQWRWCRITRINAESGIFWIELMESNRQERVDVYNVEEMLLFDAARRFYEQCERIHELIRRRGKQEAKRILEQASGPVRIGDILSEEEVDRTIADMTAHLTDTGDPDIPVLPADAPPDWGRRIGPPAD